MATQRGVHPSAEVLKAFGLGKLDERSSGAVIAHLDQCEDCRKKAAAVSGDDFINRLRQAHGRGYTPAPDNSMADAPLAPKPPTNSAPIANLPPEMAANQQYEILRELGRGGMGVVYLAKNKLMDRLEVLKVINKTLLDHPGAVERFLREIRSAAKLSHANVVGAYHALQVGELLAFAMEYIEGEDLASVVKTQGPLPVINACYYVQQAANGLQHAFEKGMVHRDIKPQNLILAREGRKHLIKVLDFGLAKVLREKSEDTGLTGEGKMLGTPDYIAPEQSLDAAKADIRADIYSLGCTLYYLLSGRPPFSGSSLWAVLMAHQMEEAKPLNLVRPEVPEELAAIVRKMMAKAPAKRYQTPLEVVQALAPFIKPGATPKSSPELSSGPVAAKPVIKKVAPVDPPPPPPAKSATTQPESANVWGALTEDSIASAAPRKSPVARKRRAATERERAAPNKWLKIGVIGAGMILMLLLGMWIRDVPKVKTPDEIKDKKIQEEKLAKPPDEIKGKKKIQEEKLAKLPEGVNDKKIQEEKPAKLPDKIKENEIQEEKPAKLPDSITNSIGMKLVLVKPGTFDMGSSPKEESRSNDEELHTVEITRSFYVGVYEVTQEQYQQVMGNNPSYFSSTGDGKDKVQGMDTRQFPVEMVSWEDAVVFCRKLSERPEEKAKGRTYRLPTEAEWEYICRGGHFYKKPSPPVHFGNSLSSTQANFDGSFPYGGAPKGPYLQRTTEVGSYRRNSHTLGIYDLHGNVWEWCADWYDAAYYKRSPQRDPKGPKPTQRRVLRGGSWGNLGRICRSACRYYNAPGDRNYNFGFRVVFVLAART